MSRVLILFSGLATVILVLAGCGDSISPRPQITVAPTPAVPARKRPPAGEDMAALSQTLKDAGIDTASLANLFKRDGQNIYALTTHGSKAVALWERLRAVVDKTGRWPVIVGDSNTADQLAEHVEAADAKKPSELIAAAEKIDAVEWFKKTAKDRKYDEPGANLETGKWDSSATPMTDFQIPKDILKQTPHPSVTVALLPTTNPWEVPAWLNYGGWNECPVPEVQVAVLKRWHGQYGAEVVGVAWDIMELRATKPPDSRDKALALAREQFIFCEDIVTQGVNSVEALAQSLLNGKIWYFWWD